MGGRGVREHKERRNLKRKDPVRLERKNSAMGPYRERVARTGGNHGESR